MSLLDLTLITVLVLLSLTILFAFIRLMLGPSLPDRVVALDLIAMLSIGIIAVYSILTDEASFIDIASILALIIFLGTVAFAFYLERRVLK